jgi:quinol monooxygenase YgiN
MTRIQVNATFPHVSSSNLAEFKKVAADALEIVKCEPGVLQYDWFFDDTQTVCVVRETYQDSEALLAHNKTMGDLLHTLSELGGGCQLAMFGDPSPLLVDVTAPAHPSIFRKSFQGKGPLPEDQGKSGAGHTRALSTDPGRDSNVGSIPPGR